MVLLSKKIPNFYVKSDCLSKAKKRSNKCTSFARNPLSGIFKESVLEKATFTGQACRSQGVEKKNEEVVGLNQKAVDNIKGRYK